MRNYIESFMQDIKDLEIEILDTTAKGCALLRMGGYLTLIMSEKQLEKLYETIDKKLHETTYTELEDKLLGLELDLEEALSEVDMYADNYKDNDGKEDDFE